MSFYLVTVGQGCYQEVSHRLMSHLDILVIAVISLLTAEVRPPLFEPYFYFASSVGQARGRGVMQIDSYTIEFTT
jgi:hypothetical protein